MYMTQASPISCLMPVVKASNIDIHLTNPHLSHLHNWKLKGWSLWLLLVTKQAWTFQLARSFSVVNARKEQYWHKKASEVKASKRMHKLYLHCISSANVAQEVHHEYELQGPPAVASYVAWLSQGHNSGIMYIINCTKITVIQISMMNITVWHSKIFQDACPCLLCSLRTLSPHWSRGSGQACRWCTRNYH